MPIYQNEFNQMMQDASANARQQMKAEADAKAAQAQQAQAEDRLKRFLAGAYGKGTSNRSFNPETGAIGTAEDSQMKLMNYLLGAQRLKEIEEERQRRGLESMGRRVEKEQIPSAAQSIAEVNAALPPEGEPLKSYGPILNAVPNWGVSVGEAIGALPKGARQERQAMEAAKGLVRHPLYGATLTEQEKQAFESAYGAPIGGSEADIRAAVRRMTEIPKSALKNIESSTSPSIVKTFREQGGLSSDSVGVNQDPEIRRLQELRKKYKRGP